MKSLIFLILLGCLGVLFVQNQQPVSLVFFGFYKTMAIPVALWLLSFFVAGLLTSLLWQILLNLSSNKTPKSSFSKETAPKAKKNRTKKRQDEKEIVDVVDSDRNEKNINESSWDEWDIEQPPPQSADTPRREIINDEDIAKPKSGYRSGSVYSYSYRETENRKEGATDQVYDANYRVIKGDKKENTQEESESEDWI